MTKITHSTIEYCAITGAKHVKKELILKEIVVPKKHFEKPTKKHDFFGKKTNKQQTK